MAHNRSKRKRTDSKSPSQSLGKTGSERPYIPAFAPSIQPKKSEHKNFSDKMSPQKQFSEHMGSAQKKDGAVFTLDSAFDPAGDQPTAIKTLVEGIVEGKKDQVLLGVTGSGKTFTMANVIAEVGCPTLIMAPNKTLAAQLYGEMKEFFPNNAVEYFVSYYDYYQPEAYVAKTDTFIQKDASINEQIDRMRHAATRALLERRDVIIIASVSCIYGIGDLETYSEMVIPVAVGQTKDPVALAKDLVSLQYTRNQLTFDRGVFRILGDVLEIFPVHQDDRAWRICFFGDEVEEIVEFDPLTGKKTAQFTEVRIYANSHYVVPRPTVTQALEHIKKELKYRVKTFEKQGKILEAQRLSERTQFDIEMLESTGFCSGIENYSRYLTGREAGSAPPTLFEYLPDNALLIMDESHVGVSQIAGMYAGDFSRKSALVEHGFRLPSCVDNRPLKQEEWDTLRPQTIFVSATPNTWELERTHGVFVEQVVRPTGLLDPVCCVRPVKTQVDDVVSECHKTVAEGGRVLITTLTKKMAENLTEYMKESGLKVQYLHSDVDTLERIEILRDLRLGVFDILVGINLLREGLDIPECSLVAILDADKEGFLRSKTSLIQTIGRAARNVGGRVLLYADTMTQSLQYALEETQRRREKQQAYNEKNGIIPQSIKKQVTDVLSNVFDTPQQTSSTVDSPLVLPEMQLKDYILLLRKAMKKSAENLDFETAASFRDEINALKIHQETLPVSSIPISEKIAEKVIK